MARFSIPIKGISTTSAYEEGATRSLVNLRPKNGAMHPVSPRKILQDLSQSYNIVFVHRGNDYENWIGTIGGTVYYDIRDANPDAITVIGTSVNGIEQIGNTLSIVTDDSVFYLFFRNGQYRFLGEMPQCPPLSFKTSTVMSHAKYYFINEYGHGTITRTTDNFLKSAKGLINKAMDVLVNGGVDENGDPIAAQGYQLFDACFVRYAFRLYDGTLTKHSPPILIMPVRNILDLKRLYYNFDAAGELDDASYTDVYGYRIYTWFDLTGFSEWADIIQSVDLFMSAPLGISQVDNIKDLPTSSSATFWDRQAITLIPAEALKNVANTSSFYLVKSFELGTSASVLSPYEFLSENKDVSSAENLIQQEVMTDDNFSNHKYGAKVSYAYNNRLHLADIKTTFFKGFNPDYFLWLDANVTTYGNYNGYKYADAPGPIWDSLLIEVEINTGLANEKVYKGLYNTDASGIYKLFLSGFISYPDPRAKKLTVYRHSSGSWYKVLAVNLKEHNFLNLAYYLNDGLNPIVQTTNTALSASPYSSTPVTLQEGNKIKVSELSNPLSFLNKNVYQAGSGEILAVATNSMNVADRNYGQYPLYIFTTQGIWTLAVGTGEVVYSTLSAPTYPEAPTTKVVCSTPFGVVFTGPRGLMLINGQSVELLSPQLEQAPVALNIEKPDQVTGVVHDPYQSSFLTYLSALDNIAYNPLESELIISDKESDFNFVLNIPAKLFYRSTEKISLIIKNTPAKLLVLEGQKLKDFSEANSSTAHMSFITRPLTFGSEDVKKLERMILRATIYELNTPVVGKAAVCMIHHSNDGALFKGTRGLQMKPNNLRDIDMGLMGSVKFRQFLFSFGGQVSDGTEIQFIDVLADNEYGNSKMK